MRAPSALLPLLVFGAQMVAQEANPFSDLAQATRATYPGKSHVGVICDYSFSRAEVRRLADALGSGRITVVDIKVGDQASAAAQTLRNQGAEVMVLLPKDRILHDGSPQATVAHWRIAGYMPMIGTSPRALENGADFAIGEATGHELKVNDRLRGIIGPFTPAAKVARGSAQVRVLRAR